MSDKHFVGLKLTAFEDQGTTRPISRITLQVDDDKFITAGDDSGLELLGECPYATQEMADALLKKLKGYKYQMLRADNCTIDPSAELGDGVTANGVYGVLARMSDDGNGYPNVEAPGEADLEDEYPVKDGGPITQSFNRKLADTRSTITKTSEQISLRIEKMDEELGKAIEDNYSEIMQTLNSISLTVKNGETSSSITLTAKGIEAQSVEIKMTGLVTFEGLEGGTTKINGACIQTGTIDAERLNLSGAISWGDLSSKCQTTIEGLMPELPDYIESTYINGDSVSSPVLRGGIVSGSRFTDPNQINYIKMREVSSGAANYDAYLEHYCTRYSTYSPVLQMGYHKSGNNTCWTLAPFGSDIINHYANNDTCYPVGDWNFNICNPYNLSLTTSRSCTVQWDCISDAPTSLPAKWS